MAFNCTSVHPIRFAFIFVFATLCVAANAQSQVAPANDPYGLRPLPPVAGQPTTPTIPAPQPGTNVQSNVAPAQPGNGTSTIPMVGNGQPNVAANPNPNPPSYNMPTGQPPVGAQPGNQPPVGTQPGLQPQAGTQPLPGAQLDNSAQPVNTVQPGQQPAAAAKSRFPEGFPLSVTEEAFVNDVLRVWETESSKVNTFECQFERWRYWSSDINEQKLRYPNVPAKLLEVPRFKDKGELGYAKPDKARYHVKEISLRDPNPKLDKDSKPVYDWKVDAFSVGERWISDGKKTYNYKTTTEYKDGKPKVEKIIEVMPIPVEFQGKSIVDGPLPFVFGAEASKLNARYFIRVVPTPNANNIIRLEAYPKTMADYRNYKKVEIILDRKTMLPTAIQILLKDVEVKPGQFDREWVFYSFTNSKVNSAFNQLFGGFAPSRTEFGWKQVQVDAPMDSGEQPIAPPATPPTSPMGPSVPRPNY